MREQQFSAMVNQFQPGIFTALNDKKEEMIQSDIRGIRVREIGSFELKGLKISPLQAVELARLLGVEIEE